MKIRNVCSSSFLACCQDGTFYGKCTYLVLGISLLILIQMCFYGEKNKLAADDSQFRVCYAGFRLSSIMCIDFKNLQCLCLSLSFVISAPSLLFFLPSQFV